MTGTETALHEEVKSPAGRARHEVKYVIAGAYACLAREWLEHHAAPDPRFEHNMVHSLYFDTTDMEACDRKRDSDFLKWKVRLRWYTDESRARFSGKAFLEAKHKEGYLSRKARIALDLDVERFHRDPFAQARLVNPADHMLLPASSPLIPLAVISYLRHRFIDMSSGSRLALDHRIEARAGDRFPFRHRACRLDEAVLEIKGPRAGGLSSAFFMLQELTGARKQAFSKYGECVRRLMG